MRNVYLAAACASALFATAALAGPFDGFKGKMKEGLYEMKMKAEMPGMPMAMPETTMQHCVTAQDIEGGKMGGKDQMPKDCEIKDMKMSGNNASYKMVCKGQTNMTADVNMTFTDNGYRMDQKVAMNQGGQVMNMTNRIESKYIGPCKK